MTSHRIPLWSLVPRRLSLKTFSLVRPVAYLVIPALSAVVGLLPGEAEAALYRWTGAANGDTTWDKRTGNNVTNWDLNDGSIPDADDDVIFGVNNVTDQSLFVKLGTDRTVKSARFERNDSGTTLYKLDSSVPGQNTLSISESLTVERGEQEIHSNVQVLNSMTWEISNFNGTGFTDGYLTIFGELQGANDVVLTLSKGGSANSGSLELANSDASFLGTIANESIDLLMSNGALRNAYYQHLGTAGLFYFGGGTVSFGGLQFPGLEFPGTTLSIGSGGLEITHTSDRETPETIGKLNISGGRMRLRGAFHCDLSATGNDQIEVLNDLNLTDASLEIRGTLDYYEERVIATYGTRTGEFDISALPPGYSVRYEATQAVLVGISPDVLYVDEAATGTGTGHDWENAFTSLQDALTQARASIGEAGFNNEIWVAKGVYHPDATGVDRTASFELIDGVDIYGGFDGSESAIEERDLRTNVSVLSGDIDGDDTKDTNGVTLSADDIVDNNSYTVVFGRLVECVLDGFTISGGLANLTTGDGTRGSHGRGGAIFIDTNTIKTPTIKRCRLIGNFAQQGGALFTDSQGSVDIDSCDFRGNKSGGRGGACYLWQNQTMTTNSNFSGNYSGDDGGAIYDDVLTVGTTEYLNCTFTGNRSIDNGGAINLSIRNDNPNDPVMINTVIWDNLSETPGTANDSLNNSAAFSVFFSCVEHVDYTSASPSNFDGTNNANAPSFLTSVDPTSAPTAAGNPVPSKNDRIVNNGSDSSVNGLNEDVTGAPRISGVRVDIGAYENDQTAPVITLLGDLITNVELDDTATFVDPGFTAFDGHDGDLTGSVIVIGSVDMGSLTTDLLTYLVSDAAGNVASAGRSITKKDTIKPTITAPADIMDVEITSPDGAAVSLGTPTMEDNASAEPTPTNDAPNSFPLGTTNVSWTAQDASGNVSDADLQVVTVVDTSDPVFTSLPLPDVRAPYTGAPVSVTLTNPGVSDNGDASPAFSNNAPPTFPLGTTVVRWTVTDASGNSVSADQNVVVFDDTPPTITAPTNIAGLEGNTSITDPSDSSNQIGGYTGLDTGSPTNVTDDIDPTVTVTNDAPTIFPLGTTTVTWRAEDDAGNFTEVTQTVQVQDTTAPILTLIGEKVVQLDGGMEFSVPSVSVDEVCDTDLQVEVFPRLDVNSSDGVYLVTYNAMDESGNQANTVDRVVILGSFPAAHYVDETSDFTITTDRGAAGLSEGDIVTWNGPSGAVPDLIWAVNAHPNLLDAVAKVPSGGSVQIGAGTFDAGAEVSIAKDVTITGSGAGMTNLTGDGYSSILTIPWSETASHDVTLERFSVVNCTPSDGGALVSLRSQGEVRVNNVKFTGNDLNFGVLLRLENDAALTNCEVSGCILDEGALIFMGRNPSLSLSVPSPRLINCTLAGNQAWRHEESFGLSEGGFDNCIIYGNEFTSSRPPNAAVIYRHCLVQGFSPTQFTAASPSNVGNLDGTETSNHPLFLKEVALSTLPSTSGDYRIASNSPMVDSGDSALNASSEDLSGNTRILGAGIDIGAHEVVDTAIQGGTESFIFTDASGIGTFELNDLVGDFTGNPSSYAFVSNTNPDLVGLNLIGSKVNVTLDQAGFTTLRFSATDGSSTGVHTVHFGVSASPVFVDANATGAGTGLNWSDAFTNINDALLAKFPDAALDAWIADGTYFPDDGKNKQQGDQTEVIELPEGVRLYGGFAGDETQLSERAPSVNLSIISGDLDNNDTDVNGDGVVDDYSGLTGENSFRLMECYRVSSATVVDGLVFTGGDGNTGGLSGPCIYADESSLQVSNCLLQGNYGGDRGSSLRFDGRRSGGRTNYRPHVSYCRFVGNRSADDSGLHVDNSVLTIEHCEFTSNHGGSGAGVYVNESTVTIDNCEFRGNRAANGGMMYVDGGEEGAEVVVSNCLITGNYSTGEGAIVDVEVEEDPVTLEFDSCSIGGNFCDSSDDVHQLFGMRDNSTLIFENSVVWGNGHQRGLIKDLLIATDGTLEMRNSLIETYSAADANGASVNSSGNLDATTPGFDPFFMSPINAASAPSIAGDYRLLSGSPLIGTGDQTLTNATLDLDDRPRVIGTSMDIGAYEAGSAYDAWVAHYFPGENDDNIIGFTVDPGDTGVPNAIAFLTASDPTTFDPNSRAQVSESNGTLTYVWRRSSAATTAFVQYSTNLTTWDPITGVTGITVTETSDGFEPGVDRIQVDVDTTIHGECFVRQGITAPQ